MSPAMMQFALHLFATAQRKGVLRGRPYEQAVGATLYITAKRFGKPVRLNQLCEMLSDSPSVRTLRRVVRLIREAVSEQVSVVDPANYVHLACSKLGVTAPSREWALRIVEQWRQARRIQGANVGVISPRVLAAVAIYIACMKANHPISQKRVGAAIDVSEGGVRRSISRVCKVVGIHDLDPLPEGADLILETSTLMNR